jgi:AAA+ ATPase superfamily predicted ATPase
VIALFVDRNVELEELRRLLVSDGFGFAVLYGRRRIGNTRLELDALKEQNHIS